jgi:hypothetical protein
LIRVLLQHSVFFHEGGTRNQKHPYTPSRGGSAVLEVISVFFCRSDSDL